MHKFLLHKLGAKALLILALHSTVLPAGPKKLSIPLMVAGQFDAATTYRVLSTCPPTERCWEVNPLLKPFADSPMIFPAIAVGDSLVLNISNRYHGPHRKILRAILVGGFIGLHVWCGFHKIGLARSH